MLKAVRVLGLSLLLVAPATALAELYMAPLDRAAWQVEQSTVSCRLHQSVPKYGAVVFETLAGSPQRFYASAEQNPMQSGPSALIANAPSWNPERKPQPLGSVDVGAGRQPIVLDEAPSQRLLQALRDGLVPELERPGLSDAEQSVRLGLSPVNFQRAYVQYDQCVVQLLPFSRAQMVNTSIQFNREQTELDGAARKKIDLLLRYIKADRGTVKIDIYALSDDRIRRLENLELVKQRTQRVQAYLVERGIGADSISVSYRTVRGGKDLSKRYVTIHWRPTLATR